jgi:hypothetical protein
MIVVPTNTLNHPSFPRILGARYCPDLAKFISRPGSVVRNKVLAFIAKKYKITRHHQERDWILRSATVVTAQVIQSFPLGGVRDSKVPNMIPASLSKKTLHDIRTLNQKEIKAD